MAANNSSSVNGGQLSYVSRDCETVPVELACDSIRRIDLSDNRLRSLQGLEQFEFVEELVLDQNGLTDESMKTLPYLRRLHTLSLNKNLRRLPALTYLSLLCNEACPDQLSAQDKDDDDYRRYSEVRPADRLEAAQKGPYLQVVRPSNNSFKDNMESGADSPAGDYQPLPQQLRDDSDTRGISKPIRG